MPFRNQPAWTGRGVLRGALGLSLVAAGLTAHGQMQLTNGTAELQTVINARQALDEFSGLQVEAIPATMLGTASGVAIFPNMVKGGFILGVNYGKGVLLVRRPDGSWSPPAMVTMGGGSLGFQAGLQAADIVLVFATPRSLQGILSGGKVTLGADASVALGPVGRQANASTDARLGAEIYSYARSRGLFAGVSFSGASLSIDAPANAMLYGRFGVTPQDVYEARGLAFHPEVEQLIADLASRASPPASQVPQPGVQPQVEPRQALVPPPQATESGPQLRTPPPAPPPAAGPTPGTLPIQPVAPSPAGNPPLVPIR
jgi:lipid-binding SYLF domain-containing protein